MFGDFLNITQFVSGKIKVKTQDSGSSLLLLHYSALPQWTCYN